MHMAMQCEHRLVAFENVRHCRAANGGLLHPARNDDGLEGAIKFWSFIYAGIVRRHMDIVDGLRLVLDLPRQRIEPRFQLIFGQLARAMPGGDVGGAKGDHFACVAQHDHALFRIDHQSTPVQNSVDGGRVVVAGGNVALDARPAQALFRDIHPAANRLAGQLDKEFFDMRLIGLQPCNFFPRQYGRVIPGIPQLFLRPRQVCFTHMVLFTMPAKGIVARVIALYWHNQFARDIPAENQDISLIEFCRVDEFAKADIRPVNIRREINAQSAHSVYLLTYLSFRRDKGWRGVDVGAWCLSPCLFAYPTRTSTRPPLIRITAPCPYGFAYSPTQQGQAPGPLTSASPPIVPTPNLEFAPYYSGGISSKAWAISCLRTLRVTMREMK